MNGYRNAEGMWRVRIPSTFAAQTGFFTNRMSMDITNIDQEIIPNTLFFTSTPCLHDFSTQFEFLLCILTVSVPHNLDLYMDCTSLIPSDIHFTKTIEEILFLPFMLPASIIFQSPKQSKS